MEIKGTKLFDGFVFLGKDFLDKRSRVDTLEHLRDIDPNTIPEGFRVFVQDTKTWYEYDPEFHSEITGHWKTAEGMEQMDSTEFVYAIVDSEGKVLSGIRVDGTVFNPTLETGGAVFSQMEVDEFLWAVVDTQGLVLFGIKKDGSLYAPKGIPDEVQERFDELSGITVLTNTDNWLFAFVDPNDTVIWGIQPDGSVYQGKGIPDEVQSEFDRIWSRLRDFDNLKVLENTGVWLLAITDTENKVVWGIEKDGTVYTGKGISEETKAELDKIKARLADFDGISVLENTDNSLFAIQDTAGNILFGIEPSGSIYQGRGIPEDAREWLEALDRLGYKVMSNETYIYAICDADGNVLFGIDHKGRSVVNGIDGVGTLEVVETDTFVYAIYDSKGNILFAILKDGTTWMSQVDGSNASEVANEYLKTFEDGEFIHIVNDKDGLIVFGVRIDGSIYIPKGMSEDAKRYFKKIEKRLDTLEDILNNGEFKTKVDYSDASFLSIPEPQYAVLNIISSYNLSNLSKPGRGGAKAGVNYDLPTQVEFWDMQGNYFKKWTLMKAQGNSSMGFIKKNLAFDFLNENPNDEDFDEDNTFELRIGKWAPFDSFHLKAYYTDFFRGVGPCSYELYDRIVRTRGNRKDRPWKKMLIDMDDIGVTTTSFDHPIEDNDLQFDTGARCFPGGFPVIVLQNGEFYGIYSWQIKKHRDNFHMSKSKPKHIHLDGDLHQAYIWNGRNNIRWIGFEIRNPKKLVYAEPHFDNEKGEYTYKYDADIAQAEIAGTDDNLGAYKGAWSETYNEGNGYELNTIVDWTDENGDTHQFLNQVEGNKKEPTIDFDKERNIDKDPDFKNKTKCGWINCTNTVKVKDSIMNLSDRMAELKAVDATGSANDVRTLYEKYFDPENMIDYMIVSDLIKNSDGFAKNWQWFTYDGKKWFVGLYDVDMSFGGHFQGNQITAPLTGHISTSISLPNGYITKYYDTELKARYQDLMAAGIIDADAIFRIVYNWTMRIGEHYFEQEWIKWPQSPCIGESTVRETYWTPIMNGKKHQSMTEANWKAQGVYEFDPANVKKGGDGNPIYTDDEQTNTLAYAVGDKVYFGLNSTMGFYGFECVQDVPTIDISSRTDNGKRVVTTYSPISYFRHTDNIYRIQKWIEKEVANMNTLYNYTAPSTVASSISAGTIADIIAG